MIEDSGKSDPLVFISYSHSDFIEVSRLRNDILAAGIKVWWDKDILGGQDWKYEIREAMRKCDAVILCLSKKCLTRKRSGIYPEALDAIAAYREYKPGEIFLIPVRFSECHIPSVEIDSTRTLDRLQYIDLFPHESWKENLQKIIASIECVCPPQLTVTKYTNTTIFTATTHSNLEIEITIDRDFKSYTESDQDRFLCAIREFLKMNGNLKIKRKIPGSVKITLELSPERAEGLSRAIKAGHFREYDAVEATVKYPARGRKTSLTIRLTSAERRTLLAWQRKTTVPAGLAKRGRIILLVADGVPIARIAATLGLSRRFVYKWTKRFLQYGVDGISDRVKGTRSRDSATTASHFNPHSKIPYKSFESNRT